MRDAFWPVVLIGGLAALYWYRWEVGHMALDATVGTATDEVDTLARTMWGEARGEGRVGMEAVANVVVNRVAFSKARGGYWWGNSVTEVCLKPWQFSAWNPGDPNAVKLRRVNSTDQAFSLALEIARLAVAGKLPDRTGGATHYHTRAVSPGWKAGAIKTASIGAHEFYRGVA
ncbi:cell wall hydrolase [Arenibaculum sp.]|jgi:spore germination cell wall hydrolase CwlJ-like protein|uniref:cell wall hydrolase n=1 Tax=Arenibaculum sp. TaxID=2865862 RepID=UPI002E1043FC|nr:cell wall hydrolase [Arenibaculum sp.]